MKGKTINLPEENIKKISSRFGAGKDFLNRTQKALVLKKTVNKLDYIKIRNFSSSKDYEESAKANICISASTSTSVYPTNDLISEL